MSSFLARLRAWDRWEPPVQGWGESVKVVNAPEPVSLSECAAEIERLNAENARLREALEKIGKLENVTVSDFDGTEWEHQRISRAALAGKEEK